MELDLAEKEWVCNANEALEIKLFTAQKTHKFNPQLTYQIFPEELIYGFKNLKLSLSYCAASLYSYLSIKYDAKNSNPQDVVTLLNKVVKQDTFSYDEFTARLKEDQKFKPMGEKIHEYTQGDILFELYKCDFYTKHFKQYHDRIKAFLFWFIEGSSIIEEDHRWQVLLLFQKTKDGYVFVGYSTYYPFFHYPNKLRMRISQFLILPPFQHQGHGKGLYAFMYEMFKHDDQVQDITVEDPNDFFQDMRDQVDCRNLLEGNYLKSVTLKNIKEKLEDIYKMTKLCKKQLNRCVEILLLKRLKKWDAESVREYRLFVKKRIYKKNKDVLEDMDLGDRITKLQQTFELVEDDYSEIINKI